MSRAFANHGNTSQKNDVVITPSTQKNLSRNIEKCLGDKLRLFIWKERLYVYSAKMAKSRRLKPFFFFQAL